ncbi:DUF3440 domain-containing protein [bacterium]|nr:DUF3440 domain-containing protein [bacterium]
MSKVYLQENVYEAAKKRIKHAILTYDDYFVSFSGGKDSGVLFNIVRDVAEELNRLPVKVVFSDLEIIFQETVRYTKSIMDRPDVEPYWLCLEEIEDNATSVYERYYRFWGEKEKDRWVRPMPGMPYVIHKNNIPAWLKPYYQSNKMDSWTLTSFGEALCDKNNTKSIVDFIGMRTDESYGRLMNVRAMKHRDKPNCYTYRYADRNHRTWNCLPLYDWRVEDIWHYYAESGHDYNRVYDSMQKMGISLHEQRTCYAFGETQKRTLFQWCIIEPETWEKMVDRVAGVNFGKLYNHTNLNSMRTKKPECLTWKEYTALLLKSLPKEARELFEDKFRIVFRYHKTMYEDKAGISPDIYIQDSKKEAKAKSAETGLSIKHFISWESLANAIVKRDFVFKKYGFGYSEKMEKKIAEICEKYGDL